MPAPRLGAALGAAGDDGVVFVGRGAQIGLGLGVAFRAVTEGLLRPVLQRGAERERADPLVAAVPAALELSRGEPNDLVGPHLDGTVLGLERRYARDDVERLFLDLVAVVGEREAVLRSSL
jgi:hypothetical protein